MRLRWFACEILFRECSFLAAQSPHKIDLSFLPRGLHSEPQTQMRTALRAEINAVDESRYDAILLGYAFCGGGVVGIETKSIPLIIPRAHDCFTLILGDRKRYRNYFCEHCGTYFQSYGWWERGQEITPCFVDINQEELTARFGEEGANYLQEKMSLEHYSRLAYIATEIDPDAQAENAVVAHAKNRGWDYEKIAGDLGILRRLAFGEWNEKEFFILAPRTPLAANAAWKIDEE